MSAAAHVRRVLRYHITAIGTVTLRQLPQHELSISIPAASISHFRRRGGTETKEDVRQGSQFRLSSYSSITSAAAPEMIRYEYRSEQSSAHVDNPSEAWLLASRTLSCYECKQCLRISHRSSKSFSRCSPNRPRPLQAASYKKQRASVATPPPFSYKTIPPSSPLSSLSAGCSLARKSQERSVHRAPCGNLGSLQGH